MPPSNDNSITPLGFANFRNKKVKFGIKLDDRRRHVYVIGKTGVGKSTLLENMAIADIQSGKGVAVIDPHGELAEKLLDFIPEERLDDVIYFDPSDMEYPIAFNPMEQVGTEYRHLVASGLMGVFKKIWADAWSARMQYILNNTLLSLLEFPGATLLGILRMFSEPNYRKKIVENLQDPVIKGFWVNEFSKYSQKFETEALAAIQNKVGQFVSNPLVRNILGQAHSTINMRDLMDTSKIFIANLSKGKIGEDNSALLGAMIITRLQLATMSRGDIEESKRRDFFLYVDEFQNFATDSFASILSEARKYRLSIVLAHQYISQLISADNNTKMRDAVFGNVGTIMTFRVGAADAEFLEKEYMPEFLQNDLVNLAKYNIYAKLMIDGVSSRPFSAETLPPQKPPLISHRDIIIENSRHRYGTPRKIVDEKISSEWLGQNDAAMQERMTARRNERSPSDVLRAPAPERRPMNPQAPREGSGNPAPRAQTPRFDAPLPAEHAAYGREERSPQADRLPERRHAPDRREHAPVPPNIGFENGSGVARSGNRAPRIPEEDHSGWVPLPKAPTIANGETPTADNKSQAANSREQTVPPAAPRSPEPIRPSAAPNPAPVARREAPRPPEIFRAPQREQIQRTPQREPLHLNELRKAPPQPPRPVQPQPHAKPTIDIDGLRKAISESLKKKGPEETDGNA